jgi:hypothetical protein
MFNNIFTINLLYYYVDLFFYYKTSLVNFYKLLFINNKFKLNDVELYINISKKYNIKYYFDNYEIDKINNKLIYDIYKFYKINFIDNEDIRIKIDFNYNNNNYILYYPFHKQIFKNYLENDYYIPYPPYNEDIMSNYRKSIVRPFYRISTNKSIIYSLFMIDSKNLNFVELNNINNFNNDDYHKVLINTKLFKYFSKIQTPFNDFGLLYHCPVKLKWILVENKINIYNFKNVLIKFLNIYFDENSFELQDHFIKLEDIDDYIISDRMFSELLIKNEEIMSKNNKLIIS